MNCVQQINILYLTKSNTGHAFFAKLSFCIINNGFFFIFQILTQIFRAGKFLKSFSDAFNISVFGSHFFIIIQFGTRNNFHFKINFGMIFVLLGFNVIIFSNFFQVTMDRRGFENCFLFFSYWVDNISKRGRTKKKPVKSISSKAASFFIVNMSYLFKACFFFLPIRRKLFSIFEKEGD